MIWVYGAANVVNEIDLVTDLSHDFEKALQLIDRPLVLSYCSERSTNVLRQVRTLLKGFVDLR